MSENINECSFCELLKDVKERTMKQAETHPGVNEAPTTTCKVSLVVEDSCRVEFGVRVSYNPRQLNFCPSCGRTLSQDEICW